MRARSQSTRYGLSGASSEVSFGRHSASHGSRTALISSATGAGSRGAATSVLELAEQRLEDQLGVADQRLLAGHVLVDVHRIERGVDDRLAGRHVDAEVGLGEAAADAEDQVGIAQEVIDRRRDGVAARAEREHVVLGKRALAAEAGGDRRLEQLGELLQLGPGARVVDALAGVDHRPLGAGEAPGERADRSGIGGDARQGRGLVGERLRHLLVEHVDRHLDQHRRAAAGLEAGERAPQDVRHLGARGHRLGRLGDVARVEDRVVVRLDVRDAARIAHRQDQERHGVAIGLGDAAERVLGAGAVLHREHADLLAAGQARHGVRHVQADPLLAHDDRPDADARGELEDVVDRIAEDDLDAFALQDLRDRLACLHDLPPARSRSHTTGQPPACPDACNQPSRGQALKDRTRLRLLQSCPADLTRIPVRLN